MEGIDKRLAAILKHYELNPNSLSIKMGISDSPIRNVLSGRNKPSYDLIVGILREFPEISPIWFLDGIGKMFKVQFQEQIESLTKGENIPRIITHLEIGNSLDIEGKHDYANDNINIELELINGKVISVKVKQ